MTIYSLGLLGVQFKELDIDTKTKIFKISVSVFDESNNSNVSPLPNFMTQQTPNTLYGMAKMNVRYEDLPSFCKESLFDALLRIMGHMNDQEVANTIYA